MSRPLEGYPIMPDEAAENEQATTQADTADEAVEEQQSDETDEVTDADTDSAADDKPQAGSVFDEKAARDKIHKANQEAASLRKRLRDAQNENKRLAPLAKRAQEADEANQSEAEQLQGQLAEREQQLAALREQTVRAEVRAQAAVTFADPTDAEALLDVGAYVGDDGVIDRDQIKADLEDLLDRKPHLAKPKPETQQQRRKPAPDRTQASGANQPRAKDPASEFAGFVNSALLKGRR